VLPRKGRVEHRVLGFLDRCIRVLNRKRGVVFGVLGVPLRPLRVVLRPLGIDVLANLCDVFVPRALPVIPPDGELSLACVRGLAQLLSLVTVAATVLGTVTVPGRTERSLSAPRLD
jgi:hypothetical protein